MKERVIICIPMSEFRKKANSLNMTEEQFVDIYLNKVKDKNIIKGEPISLNKLENLNIIHEEEILNLARQIFHPTNEELKIELKCSKELFSKYGIKDFQDHLSTVSPFKEFLELNSL